MIGGLHGPAIAGLAAIALVAGFIDAIAGGGGLLTLPALALSGMNPLAAVATNKLQSSFGSASATWAYWRGGGLESRSALRLMALSGAGAAGGALAVSRLPTGAASALLPFVLVAVALYFVLSPSLSDKDAAQRVSFATFAFGFAPAIGFYDGVFGPGTGSFFVLGFVELLGFGLLRATAHAKAANFASNFAALATFALSGHVVWPVGLAMGLAQFVGARAGAWAGMRKGARLIKPLIVCMCVAMAVRLAGVSW